MGSTWATALDVIVSPGEAFARLREQPRLLFPLVVLVALTCGTVLWYYRAVDLAWLVETQMQAAAPDQQPPAALEGGAVATVIGTVATVLAGGSLVLALVLWAAYLAFISMLTNDGLRFRLWFSLVAWCSLPMAFAQLATAVNLLVSDVSRLSPQHLNPLSFVNLLGLDTADAGGFVSSLDPTMLWTLALVALGYQAWTGRSAWQAGAIVLGPFVVIAALILLL